MKINKYRWAQSGTEIENEPNKNEYTYEYTFVEAC